MNTATFPTWQEQAAEARARLAEPRAINGEVFHSTRDAARHCGYSMVRLQCWVRYTPGNDAVLTLPNGIRFIRIARGIDDRRPPIYFDLQSLPIKEAQR